MCHIREAIRSPYSFAAFAKIICRTFHFSKKELLHLAKTGATVRVEGSYMHGRSGCLVVIVYIPRTVPQGVDESQYFGSEGPKGAN